MQLKSNWKAAAEALLANEFASNLTWLCRRQGSNVDIEAEASYAPRLRPNWTQLRKAETKKLESADRALPWRDAVFYYQTGCPEAMIPSK